MSARIKLLTKPMAADVSVEDFWAYLPEHRYIFEPSRDLWPGSSVNARCSPPQTADGSRATKRVPKKNKGGAIAFEDAPISATEWLDQHRAVEQMTWAPGEGTVIRDRLVSGGGWIDRPGCTVFNLYRQPQTAPGNHELAGPWIEHVNWVYGSAAGHIIAWLAHRVQQPGEKPNHALVLGGAPGIGKDTLLEPVKYAVGAWNFTEVTPQHLLGRFNGFVKSVILRISEARDLGDVDRYAFYDHMKIYTAAPPDVLRVDEKNVREYSVMNVCGVIITTNHKADGLFLPADDRRHFVAWSDLTAADFPEDYWNDLWRWYETGGREHAAAYLRKYRAVTFDAKAPPPKTQAFWEIVDANRAPEDAEVADVLDRLAEPSFDREAGPVDAVTIADLQAYASDTFRTWLEDRRNRRQIPHRLEAAGYIPMRNDAAKDGLWVVGGRRQAVYCRRDLSIRDRHLAAAKRAARTS